MWLIEESTRLEMERAIAAGLMPTASEQVEYTSRFYAQEGDEPRSLEIAGDRATIRVHGALTKRPNILALLFGGGNSTYADMTAAVNRANGDPAVKEISLLIDSPGGTIDGLFDMLAALEAVDKPITAYIDGLAASAAYSIAAQADRIVANNHAARIGSIGVMAQFLIRDEVVTLTSTDAPNKAPDVTTDAGKATIVEHLDALHDLFVESIANGRGVTPKEVNERFGQGAVLLAGEALKRGMLDEVASVKLQSVKSQKPAAARGGKQAKAEAITMDLETLKAEHPETYRAAVAVGVKQESDRVCGHLLMGEKSGALNVAVKACREGTEFGSATVQAEYLTAGMARSDTAARAEDDAAAAAADTAAESTDAAGAESDALIARLEEKYGVE